MSQRLARMARALNHHWKRGLLVAILSVFALSAFAASGENPPEDFTVPGAESDEALALFEEHQEQFAGAEATLVFTVSERAVR